MPELGLLGPSDPHQRHRSPAALRPGPVLQENPAHQTQPETDKARHRGLGGRLGPGRHVSHADSSDCRAQDYERRLQVSQVTADENLLNHVKKNLLFCHNNKVDVP